MVASDRRRGGRGSLVGQPPSQPRQRTFHAHVDGLAQRDRDDEGDDGERGGAQSVCSSRTVITMPWNR
jgi:hypothetical protein